MENNLKRGAYPNLAHGRKASRKRGSVPSKLDNPSEDHTSSTQLYKPQTLIWRLMGYASAIQSDTYYSGTYCYGKTPGQTSLGFCPLGPGLAPAHSTERERRPPQRSAEGGAAALSNHPCQIKSELRHSSWLHNHASLCSGANI